MNDHTKIAVANSFKHLAPTQSLGEGISSGFVSIGYKGKTWSLKQGGEDAKYFVDEKGVPLPHFDCVILAMNSHISKMFYTPGTYNEDSAGAPICTALNGDKPDAGVPQPQAPSCGVCKNNVWGSAANGGRGKACQDHRKLAVLIMPYMTKHILDKPLLEPVYFKVPPASLKPLKAYGDTLIHRGVHFAAVITRVTFVPGKQFEMKFEILQPLTDAEAPVVLPLMEDPQTRNIIGSTGAVYEEEDAPPEIKRPDKQPVESGLLQAFGGNGDKPVENVTQLPAKRGPGRPRKNVGEKGLESMAPPENVALSRQAQADQGDDEPQLPWNEADGDLDDAVAKALGDKMGGMLPK